MTPLVNLPAATTTFASLGAYSAPMFDELSPIMFLIVGLAVGAIIVAVLIEYIPAAFHFFSSHRKRFNRAYDE